MAEPVLVLTSLWLKNPTFYHTVVQAKYSGMMWQWHIALITFHFSDCKLIQNKVLQIIFLQNKVTKLRWHHSEFG